MKNDKIGGKSRSDGFPPYSVVPTVPPAQAPAREPLRILLLEDSAADTALIRHILRKSNPGAVLTQVATRGAFEAELIHQLPDVILSDYTLPGFDGLRALASARRIAPRVPFIFVTGTLGEAVAIDMLKLGATDYVLKSRLDWLPPAIVRALSEVQLSRGREQAEEDLKQSHAQLRVLASHLQRVREEERTRIALQVHDELGQDLTGLKLAISRVAGRLRGVPAVRRELHAVCGQIDATIQSVRRISTDLRPAVLDSLGLVAAIEWQAGEFQERTGIICELKIDLPESIWEQHFSTACFRIFQEMLTNIIRHANATRVEVKLAQDGPDLVLAVRDNGRGITGEEIVDVRSIGLIGMRERAAQAGGIMLFFGLPGEGSTVTLRAPLPAVLKSSLAQHPISGTA